jgi:sporulation protein YlmC with PRC-barrel domain
MRNGALWRALAVALAAAAATAGYAQTETPRDRHDLVDLHDDATADVIPLSEWRYDELYEGWYADAVLGMPVRGPQGGDDIGEVKNLLIDTQGTIVALIAEIGGFGELGDTHVAIPWSAVERRADAIKVPVTEDTVTEYGLFEDDFFSRLDVGAVGAVTEDVRTGPRVWKATELLDDYALIEPGEPYGYVSDLVFDDAGRLKSVIVNASNAELGYLGDYAYPWYGHEQGWRPEARAYQLPYTREQIAGLTVFDYERFEEESDF